MIFILILQLECELQEDTLGDFRALLCPIHTQQILFEKLHELPSLFSTVFPWLLTRRKTLKNPERRIPWKLGRVAAPDLPFSLGGWRGGFLFSPEQVWLAPEGAIAGQLPEERQPYKGSGWHELSGCAQKRPGSQGRRGHTQSPLPARAQAAGHPYCCCDFPNPLSPSSHRWLSGGLGSQRPPLVVGCLPADLA